VAGVPVGPASAAQIRLLVARLFDRERLVTGRQH
jgi:hypothetical protein